MAKLPFVFVAVLGAACASPAPSLPTPTPIPDMTPIASSSPALELPSPIVSPTASPLILPMGVVVGPERSCTTDLSSSYCEALVARALDSAGWVEGHWSAADVSSTTIHEASNAPGIIRTMALVAVVALHLRDGRTIYVPIFCGPGYPLCDAPPTP